MLTERSMRYDSSASPAKYASTASPEFEEAWIFQTRLLDGLHAPLRHETDRLGAGDDLSDLSLLAASARRDRGFL
jgi:hypothetical protein